MQFHSPAWRLHSSDDRRVSSACQQPDGLLRGGSALHIAKDAREEKLSARKKAQMPPEDIRQHMEMERLYRQQVHCRIRSMINRSINSV